MCIVIDSNNIPSVFNPYASDHNEFNPILEWIDNGHAKIVYGGTKYKKELSKMPNYLPILIERKKAGQVYEVNDANVDKVEKEICRKTSKTYFNDQMIVAIVIVSHCRFICSSNKEHLCFFKKISLYPKKFKRPKIYSGLKNVDLLNDRHILGKCGPCCSGD